MADMRAKVQQQGLALATDSSGFDDIYQNREHALQTNERSALVDMWTRAGRVFIYNNPVIGQPETMSANGTNVTLTAPSVRFTVPSGATVVPIDFQARVATVIAKDDTFAVIATASNSFTSGGDAVAMLNANAYINSTNASPVPATVTNLHYSDTAIVEDTLVGPRLLKHVKREGQTSEVNTTWMPEYNILKGDKMVYMKGPASFLVFIVQETTAAEAEFSGSYAVLESGIIG